MAVFDSHLCFYPNIILFFLDMLKFIVSHLIKLKKMKHVYFIECVAAHLLRLGQTIRFKVFLRLLWADTLSLTTRAAFCPFMHLGHRGWVFV